MRDLYNISDEEREKFLDKYYFRLKSTLFSYIHELTDEEKYSVETYDLINSWGKDELVLILMGLTKKEGVEIL